MTECGPWAWCLWRCDEVTECRCAGIEVRVVFEVVHNGQHHIVHFIQLSFHGLKKGA